MDVFQKESSQIYSLSGRMITNGQMPIFKVLYILNVKKFVIKQIGLFVFRMERKRLTIVLRLSSKGVAHVYVQYFSSTSPVLVQYFSSI